MSDLIITTGGLSKAYGRGQSESRQHTGFTLHGLLSVRENLDFFADLYRVPLAQREQRISDLLRFARLDHAVDRRAQHLSGGMKKKLALASDCTGLSRY